MNEALPPDVTQLLEAVASGNGESLDALLEAVYNDLRAISQRQLQAERANHTLEPTGLVHEAYLRLVQQTEVSWQNRAHFFSIAARVIRRVLVDHARMRQRDKRGGGVSRETFSETRILAGEQEFDLLELDEALHRLAEDDEEVAKVLEMKFFGGREHDEIAHVLGISERSVRRRWAYAKAWLLRELGGND